MTPFGATTPLRRRLLTIKEHAHAVPRLQFTVRGEARTRLARLQLPSGLLALASVRLRNDQPIGHLGLEVSDHCRLGSRY
jgi:hypothetical protein